MVVVVVVVVDWANSRKIESWATEVWWFNGCHLVGSPASNHCKFFYRTFACFSLLCILHKLCKS